MENNQIENNSKAPPLNFTEGAIREIKQLRYDKELPEDYCLRIGVKGGGCSGLSYILGFDEPQKLDETFEYQGIKIIINQAHAMYLIGMEIDFLNGLNNRGFTFNNPNATESCGCGSSFSA